MKTDNPIPKYSISEAVKEINKLVIKAPVRRGDVVSKNLCGLGVDVIATRSIGT